MDLTNDNITEKFDFRYYIRLCRRYWYWFVISVVLCGGIGVFYALSTVPVYQVVANILISDEDSSRPSNAMSELASQFSAGNMMGGTNSVDDEINVVRSHSNLRQTVKDLGLNTGYTVTRFRVFDRDVADKTPVVMTCDPAIADTLGCYIGFKVVVNKEHKVSIKAKANDKTVIADVKDKPFPVTLSTPYGDFVFDKTKYLKKGKGVKMTVGFSSYDASAEGLAESVSIYIPSKRANIISFAVHSPHSQYAQRILNTIIDNYNISGINEKRKKDQKTADFVAERLASISKDLNLSEEDIEHYKRSNKLTDVGADASKWMSRSTTLESQIMNAETELHLLEMTRDFINEPGNEWQLIPALNVNAAVPVDAYNGLLLQRMQLQNTARGENAILKKLDEQISALRDNLKKSLHKAYENASVRLHDLRVQAGESKAQLSKFPEYERQFGNIKRQQAIKEELYLYLLKKQEETSIALANSMPRAKIVDEAYALSEPVNLSKKKLVAIALSIGLIIPVVLIFLFDKLKNKFDTIGELERLTPVPVLGEVCKKTDAGSPLVVKSVGGSTSVAELFRLIRSNLQFILGNTGSKVVLLTSTISGEGKSFISINLASSFAVLGKKVLLMGLDIRNPKLAEYLELSLTDGFTSYIANENITLDSIIQHDVLEKNLDIIVAGPIPPNPSELLQSERVDDLFARLRTVYDYIIIDSAPVGMVSDTFSLVRVADATVYVTRANYTTTKEIGFLNKLYAGKRLPKLSVVLNGTKTAAGYGYGYGEKSSK
ncbi:GumC family protein [Duncaniella muris]|jgi:capsular exopolysaccharide synthesis family protein|uniref:GumC family protein n=1 Tax=Duncaniella muris TaxID=2094150 RepID=UPI000A481D89|nr:tyrosine-protein kinase family protein [Duncaniella muris]